MKQKLLLVASLAIGLLAALFARAWLSAKEAEVERMKDEIRASQKKTVVLAAGRPIRKGRPITSEDFAQIRTLESVTTRDNIPVEDRGRLLGRTLVRDVPEGDPILWSYVDGGASRAKPSSEIPSGWRGVSIPVSGAAAVSGLVRPGDHVDVLGNFSISADEGAELVTMTVLQNVTVLAVGSETASSGGGAAGGAGTATLLVKPREAEILVFAQQMKGRLFLTLRNERDVRNEAVLPRVDFAKVESELEALNAARQKELGGR